MMTECWDDQGVPASCEVQVDMKYEVRVRNLAKGESVKVNARSCRY